MALEETQEDLHSREITNPAAESRQELRSMIHQVTTEELGSRGAPTPVKEGSGESRELERLVRTAQA